MLDTVMLDTVNRTARTERRATTRRDVDLEAREARSHAPLRARDLSLGGAYITDASGRSRSPGQRIDLTLSLPEDASPLAVRAEVVRAGDGWLRVCFVDVRRRDLVRLAEHLWS